VLGGGDDIKSKNAMMNTVLGLLLRGDMNCGGAEIDPNGNLFESPKPTVVVETADQRPARRAGEIPAGVIRTEAEKQKAEEEERIRREEGERLQREKEEAEEAERQRIKKENSTWNKFLKKMKKFGEDMVKEEE